MSAETVETILTRAMSDTAFASQLLADPDKALAGYDLNAEEISNLKSLSQADFNKFTQASPEERKSLSMTWNHNETVLKMHR